ncbi:hypothetical protein OIU74_021101 [Salix koriyanagi]|uniref:Protein YIP n=1 Tax=Salix koriyanagi TaxID=2511006 RepID=A0A9Q0P7A5_9ROSI|nr:hypothetical protein OIU74_021101 [Salix koriyanagi]
MMSGGVGKYTHIDNQPQVSGSVPAVTDPGHVTVQFTDSNLQTFPPSGSQGKISGGSRPPRDADDTFSKPISGPDERQQGGWFQTFTIAAYKPYFDVDTTDVLERIKDSLFPFRGTFTEKTANNPDLYGPFWICTTLIFVAASIGTFVTYIAHKLQKKEWNYDINLVTWSAGSVLWLCPCCSSCIICNSQVLFSTIRPCSTVLSLWLLLICLYSGTVLLSGALGNLQMGDSRRGRVHVSNLRGPKSPSPYYVGR